MKNYIVYNNQTGEILRTGRCVDKVFELQTIESNQSVKIGQANDIYQKIINDKITNKTQEEIDAIELEK